MSLFDLFGWIIIGLLAGGLASLTIPARTSGGCLGATLAGVIGGLIGGFLFRALFGVGVAGPCGSLIVGTIGAGLIVILMRGAPSERPAT
ncbi:MAG TPA: GlsB/YeaQ/YmgE family stress response membrane protein [Dehalococcoidia bacterium]|nr:GlsB/YeaQ/YmgE family stress response membrane protein [Dehalococcoidia bacterium]